MVINLIISCFVLVCFLSIITRLNLALIKGNYFYLNYVVMALTLLQRSFRMTLITIWNVRYGRGLKRCNDWFKHTANQLHRSLTFASFSWHLGIILKSYLGHLGIILKSYLGHEKTFVTIGIDQSMKSYLGHLGIILKSYLGHEKTFVTIGIDL